MPSVEKKRTTFAALVNSGILDVTDGYRAKNAELGGDGPIFLRAGHVTDSHISFDAAERFHTKLAAKVANKLSRAADVVITTKGNSTGRTAFVTPEMPAFVYSPHLSRWRVLDREKLDPGFLRYWSISREFQVQLRGMMASTDMAPYLSLRDQLRIEIDLPAVQEQRAIGGILSSLDDKIGHNRRTNRTLERLARAIFQAWFVDFEPVKAKAAGERAFPGMPQAVFDTLPARFVESELGAIPVGWKVKSMEQVADASKGLSYKGAGLVTDPASLAGATPLHNLNAVYEGGGYKHEGIKYYKGDFKPRHVLEAGDLIVANTEQGFEYRLIGFPAIVPRRFGPRGLFTHHIYRLHPRDPDEVGRFFLYHALMSARVREEVCGCTNGTTVNMLAIDGLKRPQLCIPPPPIAAGFERLAESMHALQEAAYEESRKLAELRDLLLPKLLSGEVRATNVERAVERCV